MKTGTSERLIPVHRKLIECGLLTFVGDKRRRRETKLFADIEISANGSRSVAFSKWFTQFMRSCGAARERTCFHSFRYSFLDELRVARIDHDIAMMLGGWTIGSSRSGASENYGSGHQLPALQDAICRLSFDDVDVHHWDHFDAAQ